MNATLKLSFKTTLALLLGGFVSYLLAPKFPCKPSAEIISSIGGTLAVAGSLLGFSVSWLGQSRTMLRDIDYSSSDELFTELSIIQRELILKWGILLACSLILVATASFLKSISDTITPTSISFRIGFTIAGATLSTGLLFILRLFSAMLAVSDLKTKLDEHERTELRKKRNKPDEK